MFILIDERIPREAKSTLAAYGQLVELNVSNVTYNAIAAHPDIFFCQTPDQLILAPNTPNVVFERLKTEKIKCIIGHQAIGMQYPQSSHYNAVVTKKYLIHNTLHTDEKIFENCTDKKIISLNQGYTRCNLIDLDGNNFITSDRGIYKQLQFWEEIKVMYVNPDKIILPGVKNGFFGGCCGIYQHKFFILGSLKYIAEGDAIKDFINSLGMLVIELYDGPLYDGGSIFFI